MNLQSDSCLAVNSGQNRFPHYRPKQRYRQGLHNAKRRPGSDRSRRTCRLVVQSQYVLPRQPVLVGPSDDVRKLGSSIARTDRPILSGAGGGIFFLWQLGIVKYLMSRYDLRNIDFVGASAGALVVTLAACQVDPDEALVVAHRIATDYSLFDRPLGFAGVGGNIVRAWLEECLPSTAADICYDRVKVVVTEVPSLKLAYATNFTSKQDLIDCNLASIHVPFFLTGRPTTCLRGRQVMDGSFYDFIQWKNSQLLTCEGRSFIMDYTQDKELKAKRLDFLKLGGYDKVLALKDKGYQYAQRVDAEGGFDQYLGLVRRSAAAHRPRPPAVQDSSRIFIPDQQSYA